MNLIKAIWSVLLATSLFLASAACGNGENANDTPVSQVEFDKAEVGQKIGVAQFKYDTIVLKMADGTEKHVQINGMDLYKLNGGIKVDGTIWEIVQRSGVKMADIFKKAGVTVDDKTPVNLVGGDGFDPLRTKFKNDLSKLPHTDFMRAHAYVYADDPGSKHPGYPDIGNDGILIDYDLASDADVPAYLGNGIASLSTMRMKVMEKADPKTYGRDDLVPYYGIIEIDPKLDEK